MESRGSISMKLLLLLHLSALIVSQDFDFYYIVQHISDLTSSLQTNWPKLACPSGNGVQFWTHERENCSQSVLKEHDYFEAALDLKQRTNLIALTNTGIQPDGRFYSLSSIKGAIKDAIGYTPYIECNVDASRNSQLYQVYLCVDTSGSNFIECPVFPRGKRGSQIEFPTF